MSLMTEALPIEEYEAREKGIRIKKPKIIKKEPSPPEDIKNLVLYKDIDTRDLKDIASARLKLVRNKEGAVFVYVDVDIIMKPKKIPLKTGEIEYQERRITGLIPEADWYKLYREVRDKIDIDKIEF